MKQEVPTIAIVDDSHLHRMLLRTWLLKIGYTVAFEAENGMECVKQLKELPTIPAIVILDIEMPVMDGPETASVLKKEWSTIRIIANSASADVEDIERMMNSGADVFINKHGMKKEVLLSVINDLLNGQ